MVLGLSPQESGESLRDNGGACVGERAIWRRPPMDALEGESARDGEAPAFHAWRREDGRKLNFGSRAGD